jgi:hypothetical protein
MTSRAKIFSTSTHVAVAILLPHFSTWSFSGLLRFISSQLPARAAERLGHHRHCDPEQFCDLAMSKALGSQINALQLPARKRGDHLVDPGDFPLVHQGLLRIGGEAINPAHSCGLLVAQRR